MAMMKSTKLCLFIHQNLQFQGSYECKTTAVILMFSVSFVLKLFFHVLTGKANPRKACHGCHHCPTVHILMLFLRLHQSTETESITKKFEHSHCGNALFINGLCVVCAV
jgi:hypothetical protein